MNNLLATGVLFATACTASYGTVVFDNFGTNDAYSEINGWGVFGVDSPFGGNDIQQAETFSSAVSGAVSTIELGLSAFAASGNVFSLSVYDDSSGAPGSELWNSGFLFDHAQLDLLGLEPPVVVDLNGELEITAGENYWVVLNPHANSDVVWWHNVVGDTGPHLFSLDGGPWAAGSSDITSAFRVTLVPAPSSLAAVAFGAFVASKRRRVAC